MALKLFGGRSSRRLTTGVAAQLGVRPGACRTETFPDGEIHVRLEESVRGHDVFLLQSTSPPAERHLLELLIMADASRRGGASRVTAVVPYFGYARQDRRAGGREAVTARLIVDLLAAAGIQRVVALDLHSDILEGFFQIPLEPLSAASLLVGALRERAIDDGVIVAPDLGAVRLAERFARQLDLPLAVVHKARRSPREVTERRIFGDIRGSTPILVDDMISTGGTIEAAALALLNEGAAPEVRVVATHGLLLQDAPERLSRCAREIITTDSVEWDGPAQCPLPWERVGLAPLLGRVIGGLSRDEPGVDELVVHR